MATIIGVNTISFQGKDGNLVEGTNLYTTAPLDPAKGGSGCSAEKFFLSQARLAELDFTPKVGDEVEVLFNRFGKVATVRKLPAPADEVELVI